MQATFNAWNVTRYGGPEVLHPVIRPIEMPAAGEVLVRIRASAVTRADAMMRAGRPTFARPFLGWRRPRAGLSGTGFSGEIIAVGEGVTRFAQGDAVFGETGMQFGANASHVVLPADGSLMQKPDTLSHEEAAVMTDGALTSWHFLKRVARVTPGAKVLILAGSGSLGSAAVQFAAALGAEVTATASGRNRDLVLSLGARRVIDYATEDAMPKGAGYDVIFDTIGVASFGAAKPALAAEGRYVSPVLTLGLLGAMLTSRFFGRKRALFTAVGLEKPETHRAELAEILALVAEGRFAPLMDRTYPLSDLVEAHRYVATRRKRGNVVVV